MNAKASGPATEVKNFRSRMRDTPGLSDAVSLGVSTLPNRNVHLIFVEAAIQMI
jgi:hypothetical protein